MKLDAELTLSNINWRREKAGDEDGPIAYDLKFTGDVRPEDIAGLFTTDAQYRRILGDRWDVDNDLTVTDASMIPLDVEGLGCTLELTTLLGSSGMLRWTEADIKKIVLECKPGRLIGLSLRATINPTKEQAATFHDWYSSDLQVSIWSRQHDLDLREPASPRAAAKNDQPPAEGEPALFIAVDDDADLKGAKWKDVGAPLVPGQKAPQRPKRHGTAASH